MKKSIKNAVIKRACGYLAKTFGAVLLEDENGYPYVKDNEDLLGCFVFPDE